MAFDPKIVKLTGRYCFQMSFAGTVATFALNALNQLVDGYLTVSNNSSGMAPEATANIIGRHRTSKGFIQTCGNGARRRSQRLVESIDRYR